MSGQRVSPGFVFLILLITVFVVFGDKISEFIFTGRLALNEKEMKERVAAALVNIKIRDENFRECLEAGLLRALSIADNAEADLISALETLHCSRNGISSIAGIEKFKNLVELDLSYNQIGDIGRLSDLENLSSLNLSGNEIFSINPLLGIPSLRVVSLPDTPSIDCEELAEFKNSAKFSARGGSCRKGPKYTEEEVQRVLMKRNAGRSLTQREKNVLAESGR